MSISFRALFYYYERDNLHLYRSRFMGRLMTNGERGVAERVFNNIMIFLKEKSGEDPWVLFSEAVARIRPMIYLKPRKLGGTIHYFALPVMGVRKKAIFTVICLFSSIRRVSRRPEFGLEGVADILYDASKRRGLAIDEKMGIYLKASNLI